jgi:D-alanyl-D-alanine carboxypeptidase
MLLVYHITLLGELAVQGFFLDQRWSRVLVVGALAVAMTSCGARDVATAPTQVASASAELPATLVPATPPPMATAAPSPTTIASPTSEPLPTANLATATPRPSQIDPALAADLQRILDQLVADGTIPGAVLSVHIPGQGSWRGASGFADMQRTQPMEPTTEVRIASISKVFTAVVLLQLVEEGKLSLEAPLATWFPRLVPNADIITVRGLLQHTTGLYDYLEDKHFLSEALQAPDYVWPPAELVAYAAGRPPAFQPGARGAWDYSSTNYVILGMIVEQVTGNTLAQEMRSRIFTPLGLDHTFFPPDETVQGAAARGYRHIHDQTNISLSFAFATANLVSTAGDVQRFGDALFGGKLLKPETMDLMFTFKNGKGQYNMPDLEYGLGVMRNRLEVGVDARGVARPKMASTVIGHTGGFGGFRSALWHDPEGGITIALGMNQGATDPNILAARVFKAILISQGR